MSGEVATREASSVPALATTPALEIGPQDIALPRLYVAQHMSDAVKDRLVEAGSIFTAIGSDDPDAKQISDGKEPVRFHVLAMKRGKSIQVDGELETWAHNDPDAPKDAYTTYNYVVSLPEVDQDLPYKFLLKRTGTASAKKINLALQQHVVLGPPQEVAFDLRTDFRQNVKGDYWVPVVSTAEANEDAVEAASKLAAFVPTNVSEGGASDDGAGQPAI